MKSHKQPPMPPRTPGPPCEAEAVVVTPYDVTQKAEAPLFAQTHVRCCHEAGHEGSHWDPAECIGWT